MTGRVRASARERQGSKYGHVGCRTRRVQTASRFLLGVFAVAGFGSTVSNVARAEPAGGLSAWARSGHSEARLVALGPSADPTQRQAAIEIRLDPGYLTYWREPGDAGLPPSLDTGGSQNIAAVDLSFPAPRRLDEAGSTLFGYQGAVTLPLRVRLSDPAQPAALAVDLDYAVCAAICLPGKASMRLQLPAATDPEAASIIDAALAAVPRPAALGAPGPLAVTGVEPLATAAGPALTVSVRAGPASALFVEAPEGWFLQAGDPVATGAGGLTFAVTIAQRPSPPAPGPLPLRLTLVDGPAAVEVPVTVDAGRLTP